LTLLWILSGAAFVIAMLAWRTARDAARRLDQLSQMYWALKYQHGELRGQLLQTSSAPPRPVETAPGRSAAGTEASPTDAFVPLSSLRR
jgi:hypothetical protein